MSRWRAAFIHLGLSISTVLLIAIALLSTWYPLSLLEAVGGLGLIGILAGVDACIGPLLTLVVFKTGKRGLTFDLTVIAILQLMALGYGLYSIYLARPVFLLFSVDRFELVQASELTPANLSAAKYPEYRVLPLTGPVIAGIKRATDPEERRKMLFEYIPQGLDYRHFPRYYVPYADVTKEAIAAAQSPKNWQPTAMQQAQATLNDYLKGHGLQPSQVKLLPLAAPKLDMTVLINGESGAVLDFLAVDPWPTPP